MTEPSATRSKSVRDEAAEVMCCLHDLLCEPAFVSALVPLVSGNTRQGDCEIAEALRFGTSVRRAEGHSSGRNTNSSVQGDCVDSAAFRRTASTLTEGNRL